MSNKKVCIDLRPLQVGHENRGIGMFLRSVLENITDNDNHYLFYAFEDQNPLTQLGIKTNVAFDIVTTPRLKNEIKQVADVVDVIKLQFHRFKPLKKFKPDVFIQFDFKLGTPNWRKVKKVLIAYDLIPLTFRSDYLPKPSSAFRIANGKKAKIKA
ncbi:MAG: hypothetical protein ACM3KH_00900, partial [Thiobacillus sp.]